MAAFGVRRLTHFAGGRVAHELAALDRPRSPHTIRGFIQINLLPRG